MLIADLQIGPQRHFFNKQKSVTYELTDMFPRTPNYMLKLAFICSTTIYDCITMRHKQIAQRQDTDNTWLHRSTIEREILLYIQTIPLWGNGIFKWPYFTNIFSKTFRQTRAKY